MTLYTHTHALVVTPLNCPRGHLNQVISCSARQKKNTNYCCFFSQLIHAIVAIVYNLIPLCVPFFTIQKIWKYMNWILHTSWKKSHCKRGKNSSLLCDKGKRILLTMRNLKYNSWNYCWFGWIFYFVLF